MSNYLIIGRAEVKDWIVKSAVMFDVWCEEVRSEDCRLNIGVVRPAVLVVRSQRCQHLSMIGIVGSRAVEMSRLSVSPPSPPSSSSSSSSHHHHLSVFTIKLGINKTVSSGQCGPICCGDVLSLLSNSCDITAIAVFSPYKLNSYRSQALFNFSPRNFHKFSQITLLEHQGLS